MLKLWRKKQLFYNFFFQNLTPFYWDLKILVPYLLNFLYVKSVSPINYQYLLNERKMNYVIVGDINLDTSKYNIASNITEYVNCINSFGCRNFINKPTRVKCGSSSCIDHVYFVCWQYNKYYFAFWYFWPLFNTFKGGFCCK